MVFLTDYVVDPDLCNDDPNCTVVDPGTGGFGDPPASFEQASGAIGAAAAMQTLIGLAFFVGLIILIVVLVRRFSKGSQRSTPPVPLTTVHPASFGTTDASAATAGVSPTTAARLEELARLRSSGVITQEEHDAGRARILGQV